MVKTSPLLDLHAGISALEKVQEIHIVSVENEVKELLWILKKDASEVVKIRTLNFTKKGTEVYENDFGNFSGAHYSPPLTFLYEPNAAIMKSGFFDALSKDFEMAKLHPNTQLFTSEILKDFPGRRFEIMEILPYNRKRLRKSLNFEKANITTRNFPESVENLRKLLKLKDGGNHYLFFTTTGKDEKICLVCAKA